MIVLETKTAVRNRQSQRPESTWSYPTEQAGQLGYEATDEGNGGQRVYQRQLPLRFKPKFQFSSDAIFFAAGSCFAREIERALHNAGKVVTSWTPMLTISNEQFHRYNTFSIINDFDSAGRQSYNKNNIHSLSNGRFTDYTGYCFLDSREEVVKARSAVIHAHQNAFDADVIVITLGLVEAWFDRETGIYLNLTPYDLFVSHSGRFECRVTSYSENLDALISLVKTMKVMNGKVRVILSVSPVPFSDTFSGQDVVIANSYSKSVLRSVAQDVAAMFDFTDYFPSYEMVMLSDPDAAWLPDRRHVRQDHVQYIVSEFVRWYMPGT